MAAGFAMIILIVLAALAFAALVIFLFVFWIMMIIDCTTRKFKEGSDKIVWIIVVVFLQIIGAIIYYFAVKRINRN